MRAKCLQTLVSCSLLARQRTPLNLAEREGNRRQGFEVFCLKIGSSRSPELALTIKPPEPGGGECRPQPGGPPGSQAAVGLRRQGAGGRGVPLHL